MVKDRVTGPSPDGSLALAELTEEMGRIEGIAAEEEDEVEASANEVEDGRFRELELAGDGPLRGGGVIGALLDAMTANEMPAGARGGTAGPSEEGWVNWLADEWKIVQGPAPR